MNGPLLNRDEVSHLISDAVASAEKAMRKFPQPNYVTAKLAEEAGEVVRAYIHRAEGRGSTADLRAETVQLIGLAIRLFFEGDQTILENAPDLSTNQKDTDHE